MARAASRISQKAAASRYEAGFRAELPSDDVIAAGQRRQAALNVVQAHGCAPCTIMVLGAQTIAHGAQDGSRIRCPLLVEGAVYKDNRPRLTGAQTQLAKRCPIPQLYADVHDKTVLDVEPDAVESLVPDFMADAGGQPALDTTAANQADTPAEPAGE